MRWSTAIVGFDNAAADLSWIPGQSCQSRVEKFHWSGQSRG